MEYAEAILCLITFGLVAVLTVLTIKAEMKSFDKYKEDSDDNRDREKPKT